MHAKPHHGESFWLIGGCFLAACVAFSFNAQSVAPIGIGILLVLAADNADTKMWRNPRREEEEKDAQNQDT